MLGDFLASNQKAKVWGIKKLIPGGTAAVREPELLRGLGERPAPQNRSPHCPPTMSSSSQQILIEDLPCARHCSGLRKTSSGQNRQISCPKEMHTHVLFSGK